MYPSGLAATKVAQMARSIPGSKKLLSIIRLYQGVDASWRLIGPGCLFVVEQTDPEALVFHLVDLGTNEVMWQHELYPSIEFSILQEHFISFEGADSIWGLSFADTCDARDFCARTLSILRSKFPRRRTRNIFKGIGGVLNRWKKKIRRRRNRDTQPRVSISSPRAFTHDVHIGGLFFNSDWWEFLVRDVGLGEDWTADSSTVEYVISSIRDYESKIHQEEEEESSLPPLPPTPTPTPPPDLIVPIRAPPRPPPLPIDDDDEDEEVRDGPTSPVPGASIPGAEPRPPSIELDQHRPQLMQWLWQRIRDRRIEIMQLAQEEEEESQGRGGGGVGVVSEGSSSGDVDVAILWDDLEEDDWT